MAGIRAACKIVSLSSKERLSEVRKVFFKANYGIVQSVLFYLCFQCVRSLALNPNLIRIWGHAGEKELFSFNIILFKCNCLMICVFSRSYSRKMCLPSQSTSSSRCLFIPTSPAAAAWLLTVPQRNPSVWLACVNCFLQASLNFSPLDNELF